MLGLAYIVVAAAAAIDAVMGAASAGSAARAPSIDLLTNCRPKTACISAELFISNAETRRIGTRKDDAFEGPILKLRGRLNGGEVRLYRVGLPGTGMDCGNDGIVALVGHSKAGYPIVQTTLGRFEIVERSVRAGHSGELILINARTGNVSSTYWGPTRPTGAGFYFEDGKVFLAEGDGPCLVAPQGVPRSFTFAPPGHCRNRGQHVPSEAVDTTTGAVEATLRRIGRGEIPRGGTFVKVPGTELLALETADPC